MTPDTAQKLLDENFADWVRALDLTVTAIDAEHAMVRMPLGDHVARVGGIVSGQALAALADTAMVFAAIGHTGAFKPFATTDLHVQFLRSGTGVAVLCRASITRAGRALVFARCDITEEDSGKPVAAATATFFAP